MPAHRAARVLFPLPDVRSLSPIKIPDSFIKKTASLSGAEVAELREKLNEVILQISRSMCETGNGDARDDSRAAKSIFDAILADPSLADGDGMLVIRLTQSVLGGSEICIIAKGGVFEVEIYPANQEVAERIAQSVADLEQRLWRCLVSMPNFKRLSVTVKKNEERKK